MEKGKVRAATRLLVDFVCACCHQDKRKVTISEDYSLFITFTVFYIYRHANCSETSIPIVYRLRSLNYYARNAGESKMQASTHCVIDSADCPH
jgi:hypothetical protein